MKKISNWKIGTVVKYKNEEFYGHIVGLTRNIHRELIPIVKFEDGKEPRYVHPGNLELVED